jgi:hypothetical protein
LIAFKDRDMKGKELMTGERCQMGPGCFSQRSSGGRMATPRQGSIYPLST